MQHFFQPSFSAHIFTSSVELVGSLSQMMLTNLYSASNSLYFSMWLPPWSILIDLNKVYHSRPPVSTATSIIFWLTRLSPVSFMLQFFAAFIVSQIAIGCYSIFSNISIEHFRHSCSIFVQVDMVCVYQLRSF